MSTRGETRIYRSGAWRRRGRGDVNPPVIDTFILGTTEPNYTNAGAGIIRPYPTITINGNVTVVAGQTLSDRIINGIVNIEVGGTLENCVVRGPAVEPTAGRPMVRVASHVPTVGGPRASIRYCEIRPQTPTAWFDGIGYKGYHAYRCVIRDTTDGFAAFSTTTDGLINILIEGCYVPSMVQWRPDYAYPGGRTRTHNDCIQFQGNLGDENDAILRGNSFNARFVEYAGTQPLEHPKYEASTVMVTPNANVQVRASLTLDKNWFRGGVQCINAGSSNNTDGKIVITNNRFERPGTDVDAPTLSISMNNNYPRQVTNNVYIDNGGAVVVNNG